MVQGFACHARGVELCETTATHVRARVRSKRLHDVDLRATAGRLVIGCSCPARSFGLDVCKHAWAALLEIDRKGGLEDLRAGPGVLPVDPAPLSTKESREASAQVEGQNEQRSTEASRERRVTRARKESSAPRTHASAPNAVKKTTPSPAEKRSTTATSARRSMSTNLAEAKTRRDAKQGGEGRASEAEPRRREAPARRDEKRRRPAKS
jgi:uncharacterized Zn finger protein